MTGELSPGELTKAADPGRYYAVTPGGDLETLRGDLHHLLNPFIGILRMRCDCGVGAFDPAEVPYAANTGATMPAGAPTSVLLPANVVVGLVHAMIVATELADFALGEWPHGDVIDRIRSEARGPARGEPRR